MSTNPLSMTIPELQVFVISPEGQKEITGFMEAKLALINSRELYEAVCQKAQSNWTPLTALKFRELRSRTTPYRKYGSAGHDAMHWDEEILNALAIRNDPVIKLATYPVEVDGGSIGALTHDLGTTLIHRYIDRNFAMGHCEIGAWLVWHMLSDIEENLRLIVWYAVNGHQHYLKDTPIVDGTYTRKHHVVEPNLVFSPEDAAKKTPIGVVGIAPYMTRTSDRMENLGARHAVRDLLALSDSQEQSNPSEWNGENLVETKGEKAVIARMQPVFRIVRSGSPSLFDWIIGVYGHSTHGAGPYSIPDKNFPSIDYLIDRKLGPLYAMLDILDSKPDMKRFSAKNTLARFKTLLKHGCNTPYFDHSWKHLFIAWNTLTAEQQAVWGKVVTHVKRSIKNWHLLVLKFATDGAQEDWANLAHEIYAEVV